ncbi:hypothetical protein [Halorubrum sp. HHNYT27]|uniref:hypothetical protein n=1 Tax=Halorubrum sp. HHNYT27 TaxID=3402275 RepID=UPI003EC0073E
MSDDPTADADPKADSDRCTATAKSTGDRCKQPAVPGGNVCRFHGGSAEQVQKKAQERLDEMADATTAKLQSRLDGVFGRLDEAEDHDQFVKLLREVRQLTTNILDRTDHGPTETREVTGDGGGPVEVTFDEEIVETPWNPDEDTE